MLILSTKYEYLIQNWKKSKGNFFSQTFERNKMPLLFQCLLSLILVHHFKICHPKIYKMAVSKPPSKNWKKMSTLFSQTLKVESNKVHLVFSNFYQELNYGHSIDLQVFPFDITTSGLLAKKSTWWFLYPKEIGLALLLIEFFFVFRTTDWQKLTILLFWDLMEDQIIF